MQADIRKFPAILGSEYQSVTMVIFVYKINHEGKKQVNLYTQSSGCARRRELVYRLPIYGYQH